MNGIRDALVCGHSDCKAMHALLSAASWAEGEEEESPLRAWIARDNTAPTTTIGWFLVWFIEV